MAKTRAFTSETGYEMVTAQQVGRRRNLYFDGEPTGEKFFSTHRVGHRRPVKHIMKDCWFFSYTGGGGTAAGGESLNHLLFKEALCSVRKIRLNLRVPTPSGSKKWCEVPITITSAEWEKAVPRAGEGVPYRADVYLEFETEHLLGTKWQGRVYLEVRHTHAVDAGKQTAFRELSLPLIEVEVPEVFSYPISDDETSDDKEEAHRLRIKRILEGENGFLVATVLSNPSSKEYLEQRVAAQERKITSLTLERDQLTAQLEAAQAKAEEAAHAHPRLQQRLELALDSQEKERVQRQAEVRRFGEIREELEEQIASLSSESQQWRWATAALVVMSMVLLGLLYLAVS